MSTITNSITGLSSNFKNLLKVEKGTGLSLLNITYYDEFSPYNKLAVTKDRIVIESSWSDEGKMTYFTRDAVVGGKSYKKGDIVFIGWNENNVKTPFVYAKGAENHKFILSLMISELLTAHREGSIMQKMKIEMVIEYLIKENLLK